MAVRNTIDLPCAPPQDGPGPTWRHLWWIALCGLGARIFMGLVSDWMAYPDELFQYGEPAHRLVLRIGSPSGLTEAHAGGEPARSPRCRRVGVPVKE